MRTFFTGCPGNRSLMLRRRKNFCIKKPTKPHTHPLHNFLLIKKHLQYVHTTKALLTHHPSSQGWASRCPYIVIHVCLSGVWLGGLLHLSYLPTLVCYYISMYIYLNKTPPPFPPHPGTVMVHEVDVLVTTNTQQPQTCTTCDTAHHGNTQVYIVHVL